MAEGESIKDRFARWRSKDDSADPAATTEPAPTDGDDVAVPADDSIDLGAEEQRRHESAADRDEAAATEATQAQQREAATSVTAATTAGDPTPTPTTSMPVPPETILAMPTVTPDGVVSPMISADTTQFDRAVPRGLQIAAAWSWRAIVIGIVLYVLGIVIGHLSEVVIPVAVAILLAAMIGPLTNRLTKWGLPRAAAAGISVVGGLAIIIGVLTLIGTQIAGQASSLGSSVSSGFNTLVGWLQNGPLHLNADWFNLDEWVKRIQNFLVDSQGTITTYASEFGTQVGHFVAGIAIVLFSLFYFLYQGRSIFSFLLKFVPRAARDRVDHSAHQGWTSLSHYVRAVILVALVDAVGVLIGALILGVPLAPALAALVFIGAFVPIVGAFVSGFVAVLVALVALGWVKALIMLAVIVGVMQLEGHVLQPFLLGRAVKLHPLAVILAIAIGVIMAGIVGALMAVPLLAFIKTFIQDLNEQQSSGLQPSSREFT